VTDGEKPIDSSYFYLKLAQRILHLFNTRTNSGVLYEVDMRLRPSGNSGLMVSHIDTFIEYQHQDAWTWEHQALVRARAVAGDKLLKSKFNYARNEIIRQRRDVAQLQVQVTQMREKMRNHLGSKDAEFFDLKQDAGGIADIEFIAQFLVLGFAARFEQLAISSDNVRIFDAVAQCHLMPAADAIKLKDIYCSYRDRGHRLALQQLPNRVESDDFEQAKQFVQQIWQQWLLTPLAVE
jgi:glutamate-ammonia-ligase adenylyltransferase